MKKVVTVSLGSSKQDFKFETNFLGQRFQVERLGADNDTTKAWELMRRYQASAAGGEVEGIERALRRAALKGGRR